MTVHSPSCRYAADHSCLFRHRRVRQRRAHWLAAAGVLLLVCGPCGPLRQGVAQSPKHSATYIQVVNKADPGLTWAAPTPIPFGEELNAVQLSAAAKTAGNFAYVPRTGAILQPGTQLLSVAFTSANPNYLDASTTVPLTVTPPGDSSFRFELNQSISKGSRIILTAGKDTSVPIRVAPVGNFHQPVTFDCSHLANIACSFTPSMIRPTTAPIQVMLTMRWLGASLAGTPAVGPLISSNHLRPRGSPSPLLASSVLLLAGIGLRRRGRGLGRRFPGRRVVMLAVLLLPSAIGCGGGEMSEQITITARSLVESRSLPVTIYIER